MDRAGLITLEQARAAGLSFDEPEPRTCPHCGAALDPLGAALAGRVAWVSAAPCPCEGAARERESEERRRAALAAKEEAARREKALSRAGVPRRYWAAEADRGNLSAEAVRSLAGMPKERQAEMHAAMEPWRRTKRELSDYVRSEGKAQAGPDGRIAKAARLVADFLESPPENPSAADLSLLREMALMTAPYAEAGAGAHKGRRRASGPKSSK